MKKTLLFVLFSFWCLLAFAEQPKHEFRATWLATVSGIDWPKTRATNDDKREQQKQELIDILDKMKAGNMNAVCMQVRSLCDAMYVSSYEPWSIALTGTRGQDPGYDPLAFALEEAHKRGMELHVWVNPFRVGTVSTSDVLWSNAGDWLIQYNNSSFSGYIIDPGYPESRAYVVKVLMEIVNKYDIDGMVMDDYFYAYGGTTNEDAKAQAKHYNPSDVIDVNGNGNTLDDWRRSNVDKVIKATYDSIQAVKPWVRFGMGPGGIWTIDNGAARAYGLTLPYNISGGDIYNSLYCNTVEWIKGGYVDYVNPQIYWSTTAKKQAYGTLCQWWSKDVCEHFSDLLPDGKRVHHFPSPAAYKIFQKSDYTYYEGYEDGYKEIQREMDANRANLSSGYTGAVFYNTSSYLHIYQQLAKSHFIYTALTPPMEWKVQDSLAAPSNLKLSGTTLTWSHPTETRFTVYAYPKGVGVKTATRNPLYLQGVVYGNSFNTSALGSLTNTTIAVYTYDRYGVEHGVAVWNEVAFPDTDPNATEITWVLNGGEFKGVEVPTNEELWEMWKKDYVTFYSNLYGSKFVASEDRAINDVLGFTWINSLGDGYAMDFMMQDTNWVWLRDYMLTIAQEDGYELDSDKEWRYHLYAFFNCDNASYRVDGYCPGPTADFTQAGQPQAWGPYSPYMKEVDVQLPSQVTETYVLPTPTHPEGYDFLGWSTTAEYTGKTVVVIPAGWVGTLYAIWEGYTPPVTSVDNTSHTKEIRVYDIMGRYLGDDIHIVPNGVLIIKQGNNTYKLIK